MEPDETDTTHGRTPDMDVRNDTFATPEPDLPEQDDPDLEDVDVPEGEG